MSGPLHSTPAVAPFNPPRDFPAPARRPAQVVVAAVGLSILALLELAKIAMLVIRRIVLGTGEPFVYGFCHSPWWGSAVWYRFR